MLSPQSFNALLKTLEEPPPHVIFILATTDPQKLPVTVLSRCLQFHLRHMSEDELAEQMAYILGEENIKFEKSALKVLSDSADGSMRDALSLLDQAIAHGSGIVNYLSVVEMLGVVERAPVWELIQKLIKNDHQGVFQIAEKFSAYSRDFAPVLAELLHALHELALAQKLPQTASKLPVIAQQLAVEIKSDELQLYYQITLHARRDLAFAPSSRMGFEMCLLRLLAFQPVQEFKDIQQPAKQQANPDENSGVDQSPLSDSTERVSGVAVQTLSSEGSVKENVVGNYSSSKIAESEQPRQQFKQEDSRTNSDQEYPKKDKKPEQQADKLENQPVNPIDGVTMEKIETIDGNNWAFIAEHLKVTGMTRQLLLNARFVDFDGQQLTVSCMNAPKTMVTDERISQISQTLGQIFNHQINLKVLDDDPLAQGESASQLHQRVIKEKQQNAKQIIDSDPVVQDLLTRFNGQIREDSVHPLDKS